ncbi:mitochondrial substrate carrier family protein [Cavenderia fasciculata]|uniref:Mitochondrial substrate carrier family protein n=1 Tax=Cavenderia fasciculata TaxID=261658 RepID=F4PGQ2_CACFS|nr:mitochondrial substrate carrier family protein [Cavenderia fasciculata]EGG24886.1 mitochondrial substrate carrier family protein [Cavenderia fasciculata]|eukprot:XP_004362737.1 mitochondrial substrate carrier family protein [Cavenderia fasciculata]
MEPTRNQRPWVDGLSASLGSSVAILVLQPLDLIKVRLQGSGFGVQTKGATTVITPSHSNGGGFFNTFVSIVKNEGVGQFWRGIGPTIVANGLAWGLYMQFYERFKTGLKDSNLLNISSQSQSSSTLSSQFHINFVAGVAAGVTQVFITNPIFMIKTRMQLQVPGSDRYYTSFFDGVRKTVQYEGFFGLYKGVVPALWLTFHGGIQMSCYDEIKLYFARLSDKPINNLTSTEIFIAGSISKFLASTILYPFQVIKTRLQDERNIATKEKGVTYNGTWDVAKKILKAEGVIGFYRGVIPNTLRVIPNSSITLLAYEEIKKLFNSVDK